MRLRSRLWVFALMMIGGAPARAAAEGFINPSFAYHFGGDAACPALFKCNSSNAGLGLSVGALGSVVGFEADFGFAKNFFGTEPLLHSDVITAMGNLIIGPKIGPARLYGVGGFGLLRVTASTALINVVVSDNNNVGYDLGGGLIILFGEHVGVRGDIRAFRSLQDLKVFNVQVPGTQLRFGRAEGGLMLVF